MVMYKPKQRLRFSLMNSALKAADHS